LLVLDAERLEFDYGREEIDFEGLGPLRSLARLASTQSGFLPPRAPKYRFDGPLGAITELCSAAAPIFAKHDRAGFRAWLDGQVAAFSAQFGGIAELKRWATPLSLAEREFLMVPLIYLNHMWRQGSPVLEPATGPSAMPDPLHAFLWSLSED